MNLDVERFTKMAYLYPKKMADLKRRTRKWRTWRNWHAK